MIGKIIAYFSNLSPGGWVFWIGVLVVVIAIAIVSGRSGVYGDQRSDFRDITIGFLFTQSADMQCGNCSDYRYELNLYAETPQGQTFLVKSIFPNTGCFITDNVWNSDFVSFKPLFQGTTTGEYKFFWTARIIHSPSPQPYPLITSGTISFLATDEDDYTARIIVLENVVSQMEGLLCSIEKEESGVWFKVGKDFLDEYSKPKIIPDLNIALISPNKSSTGVPPANEIALSFQAGGGKKIDNNSLGVVINDALVMYGGHPVGTGDSQRDFSIEIDKKSESEITVHITPPNSTVLEGMNVAVRAFAALSESSGVQALSIFNFTTAGNVRFYFIAQTEFDRTGIVAYSGMPLKKEILSEKTERLRAFALSQDKSRGAYIDLTIPVGQLVAFKTDGSSSVKVFSSADDLLYWGRERLSWSSDNRYLAFITSPVHSTTKRIWIHDMFTGGDETILEEAGIERVLWHPREKKLLYQVNDEFRIYDPSTKKSTPAGGAHRATVISLDWDTRGRLLAWISDGKPADGIYLIEPNYTTNQLLLSTRPEIAGSARFGPSGQLYLIIPNYGILQFASEQVLASRSYESWFAGGDKLDIVIKHDWMDPNAYRQGFEVR